MRLVLLPTSRETSAAFYGGGAGYRAIRDALVLLLVTLMVLNYLHLLSLSCFFASTRLPPQVSSLSLPLAKLVAVYEQLVLELLEMRELDVAR